MIVEKNVVKLAAKKATKDEYPSLDKALGQLKSAESVLRYLSWWGFLSQRGVKVG